MFILYIGRIASNLGMLAALDGVHATNEAASTVGMITGSGDTTDSLLGFAQGAMLTGLALTHMDTARQIARSNLELTASTIDLARPAVIGIA